MPSGRRASAVILLQMRWLLSLCCTLWLALPASAQKIERVTILHFTDYHSHAVPFLADGEKNVGGIVRAIGYLRPLAKEPGTLVLSGGDMMNKGAPAWSDSGLRRPAPPGRIGPGSTRRGRWPARSPRSTRAG